MFIIRRYSLLNKTCNRNLGIISNFYIGVSILYRNCGEYNIILTGNREHSYNFGRYRRKEERLEGTFLPLALRLINYINHYTKKNTT